MLKGVRLHVLPGSFPLLLAAAVLLYVLNALAIEATTGEVLELIAYAAVASAGLYFLSVNRGALIVGADGGPKRLGGARVDPDTGIHERLACNMGDSRSAIASATVDAATQIRK